MRVERSLFTFSDTMEAQLSKAKNISNQHKEPFVIPDQNLKWQNTATQKYINDSYIKTSLKLQNTFSPVLYRLIENIAVVKICF